MKQFGSLSAAMLGGENRMFFEVLSFDVLHGSDYHALVESTVAYSATSSVHENEAKPKLNFEKHSTDRYQTPPSRRSELIKNSPKRASRSIDPRVCIVRITTLSVNFLTFVWFQPSLAKGLAQCPHRRPRDHSPASEPAISPGIYRFYISRTCCIYKSRSAWRVPLGPQAQRIEREACYGLSIPYGS